MRASSAIFSREWLKGGTALLLGGIVAAGLSAAAPAKPYPVTDMSIEDEVADEFVADPAVPQGRIDVISAEGIVTLRGIVDDLLDKERAERVAMMVKGVRGVVNELEVRPYIERTPAQLRGDVVAALRLDPAAEPLEVDVAVTAPGAVRLTGTVDSNTEKRLVGRIAKSVLGVTNVENEVEVAYDAARPDEEIAEDVRKRLRWNVLVDDGLIDVAVENGVVALSGVVGSTAEKAEARVAAWVQGARSVDATGIEVERWARDGELRGRKYATKSDSDIESAVEDALLYDVRVPDQSLMVSVDDGIVTLRGKLPSLAAKRSAAETARNVVGVETVINRVKVRNAEPRSDSAIEETVEKALNRHPYVERYDIRVDVRGGTVELDGVVDYYYEKAMADDLAALQNGVVAVNNDLEVVETTRPFVYEPYLDTLPPRTYGWYDYQPYWSQQTDADIREEVEDELWWSPFVDSDAVDVSVDNGIVTLTGTVESRSERQAAENNAYEAGATWVVNDLEIATSQAS